MKEYFNPRFNHSLSLANQTLYLTTTRVWLARLSLVLAGPEKLSFYHFIL